MKNALKKTMSVLLVVIIMFGSVPLAGFVELELPKINLFSTKAEATTNYSGTCGDKLTWSLDTETGEFVISGTGAMYNWTESNRAPWSGWMWCIDSIIIGNGVTTIGDYAFYNCTTITSVEIPDSVTSIGDHAFECCSKLKKITIGNGVTNIGKDAFYDTAFYNDITNWEDDVLYIGNYLIKARTYVSGSFSIKEETKVIADLAFYDCDSLTSVTIPDSVTSIGYWAFGHCTGLTSVTIPDSVKSIGDLAFYYCTSLTSVTIPDSVTSIGDSAFHNCDSLTSVTIGNSVTSIGNSAFHNCDSLTSVIIPDSVTSIDDYAFYACTDLTSVTIPDSVTSIGGSAFGYCTSLTSVTIPDSVTSICGSAFYNTALYNESTNWENDVLYIDNCLISAKPSVSCDYSIKEGTKVIAGYAFNNCRNLISVTIPDSVTNICDYAFHSCTSLTSVTIPDSVTSIGDYSFNYCHNLTSIEIPDSVTSIGNCAFRNCNNLTSITVDSANSAYSSDEYGVLFNKDKTELIQYSSGNTRTSYVIPDSVTSIVDYAFYNCKSLTSITIPDSVTSIGNSAFEICTNLENIIIPDNVKSIGDYAFTHCSGFTSITIPDSVTSIGYRAFYGCYNLESVTIGNGVTSIDKDAFYACDSLTSAYYPGTPTQWEKITIDSGNGYLTNNLIFECYSDKPYRAAGTCGENLSWKLYPDGELFISGTGNMTDWSNYSSVPWYSYRSLIKSVTVTDNIKRIGKNAFYDCINLVSIILPENIESIGENSFYNTGFYNDSTNWEDGVLYIGKYLVSGANSSGELLIKDGTKLISDLAFYSCKSLTGITIPDSVLNIGYAAFYNCDGLKRIRLSNNLSTIESSVFGDCDNIVNIDIPDNITSIESYAFSYCKNLNAVNLNNGLMTIGECAFYMSSIVNVTIPVTVTLIQKNAFGNCDSFENVFYLGDLKSWCNIDFESSWSNPMSFAENIYFDGILFEGNISIPESIKSIKNYTFYNFLNITGVTIHGDITDIGQYAFENCTNLSDIYYNGTCEQWEKYDVELSNDTTIHFGSYVVTWDIDGYITKSTIRVGVAIPLPEKPIKEFYEFNGWDNNVPDVMPERNLTFTATWKPKVYTITWIVDDEIIETTHEYDSTIKIPELPTKTGYSIVWDKEVPTTMPGENLTFIASWAINSYTVTWKYGDKSVQQTYEYNSPITPPEAEVSGYEFIKWIPEAPELMPAEDLVFEAFLASTEFDGGWGTEDNPYLVSTKEQLNKIRNHSDRCFKLTNDIVFTESDFASGGAFYNGGKGWTPIPEFTGVIDGDGYAIRGLKIVASVTDDSTLQNCSVGFISTLDGEIKNLGLLDGSISVTAKNVKQFYVGVFAGYGYYSTITNCFNNCDIKCTESLNLGLYSDEEQPMFNGAVGGIAGSGVYVVSSSNEGDVTVNTTTTKPALSWAYDDLLKHDILVGGIVGDEAAVKECYNSGDVTLKFIFKNMSSDGKLYADCNYFAGGIAGEDTSVIDSYNTGSVNVSMGSSGAVYDWALNPIASGIIGSISGYEVNRCYNTGTLSGVDDNCAGITVIFGSGQVYNCYYLDNVENGVIQVENKGWVSDTFSFSDISELKSKFNKSPWMIDINGVPVLESTIRPARIVEISESEVSVVNKETVQLSATVLPDYATYKDVTWSSSNEDVATVDKNGLVTAKKIGEATIRATGLYSNAFAECKVTVTPADFTITWIVDGVETEETVTETNAIVEPKTPVKYGYTFSGWTPDIPDVMPDENLMFNGTWAPVECELTFDASTGSWADGTTERTETVDFNSEIVVPEAPSKPGYVFLGWALDNVNLGTDLGEMDDINGKEFKAVWVASTDTRYAVETYTMNTEGEYVKTIQNFTGETDSTVNAEYVIEEGFTLNDEMSVLSGTITADNSLVLKVYIDRNVYTFTTIIDGVLTETMYFYDSVIAEPAIPSKTGYTFVDWDKTIPLMMPANDVTITAEFDANSYDAVFNANGGKWSDGSTSKTVATNFDSEIVAPVNPIRQGYDFAGWDAEIGIMDDVNGKTFTAKWIARNDTKYIVETYTMGADGKYVVTTKTKQGTTDTVAAAETDIVTGFALNEVNSVLEGTIAGDSSLVLKVYIDRNTYTFTTVVDGVSTSKSYLYGSTVSEPVTPSKLGYKFIKWNGTIPQTMPAENLTVTAVFEKSYLCPDCGKEILGEDAINKHIASETKVNIDSGNIVSGVVSPGATITVSAPQTNGKIFSHWEVTNATVADADSAETTVVLGSGKISITAVYVDCDCKCHQGGIAGFFFKITLFFQKLFGKNLECICGSKH